jgi:hypothetical protein
VVGAGGALHETRVEPAAVGSSDLVKWAVFARLSVKEVMMQYMLLLYVSDRPRPGTPDGDAAFDEIRSFHRDCQERGVLVSSAPLRGPETATSIRIRGGKLLKTDGPFAETTEWLGGYFILDCRDFDEALELAARCPTAKDGTVELRELMA